LSGNIGKGPWKLTSVMNSGIGIGAYKRIKRIYDKIFSFFAAGSFSAFFYGLGKEDSVICSVSALFIFGLFVSNIEIYYMCYDRRDFERRYGITKMIIKKSEDSMEQISKYISQDIRIMFFSIIALISLQYGLEGELMILPDIDNLGEFFRNITLIYVITSVPLSIKKRSFERRAVEIQLACSSDIARAQERKKSISNRSSQQYRDNEQIIDDANDLNNKQAEFLSMVSTSASMKFTSLKIFLMAVLPLFI